jgi:hypothetical protein
VEHLAGGRRRTHQLSDPGEVTLDPAAGLVTWRVDGRTIYHAGEPHLPRRVRLGLGVFTMLPIRDGRSRSLRGQGMSVRYRRPRTYGMPKVH